MGIDHAELGALHLKRHRLPELMIASASYHHQPGKATQYPQVISSRIGAFWAVLLALSCL